MIAADLANHILAHGLGETSLRKIADALGTSDRMLLYYFNTKAELVAAGLSVVAAQLADRLGGALGSRRVRYRDLLQRIAAIMREPDVEPYTRVWLELAGMAARGDAAARATSREIGLGFHLWAVAQLKCKDRDRDRLAARLLVQIEGYVFVRAIGLAEIADQSLAER